MNTAAAHQRIRVEGQSHRGTHKCSPETMSLHGNVLKQVVVEGCLLLSLHSVSVP